MNYFLFTCPLLFLTVSAAPRRKSPSVILSLLLLLRSSLSTRYSDESNSKSAATEADPVGLRRSCSSATL